jgi:hypothetical protein
MGIHAVFGNIKAKRAPNAASGYKVEIVEFHDCGVNAEKVKTRRLLIPPRK